MLNKKSKGFTLIELLVVIAIIGILASIVLISLGNARDRAKDARIMAALSQIRPIAEMEYASSSNSYDTICNAAGTDFGTADGVSTIGTDIESNYPSTGTTTCRAYGDDYCVATSLNVAGVFCISSDGVARVITAAGSNTPSTACPATTSSCSL